ncbi:MAG: hypothetical protein ACK501_19220 [Planctomycetota bacterium]|jgi:hypothetical protein
MAKRQNTIPHTIASRSLFALLGVAACSGKADTQSVESIRSAVHLWVATSTDCKEHGKDYEIVGIVQVSEDGCMGWMATAASLPATPGGHVTLMLDASGHVTSTIRGR